MTGLASKRPKLFYGWYIVGAATVAGFANYAVFGLGQSLFVKDVTDEFGWSVTAISIGFSLRTFEQGIIAPLGGYLIDRYGARLMAVIGTLLMFLGLINFAFMDQLWQFYLSSVTIALGQGIGANQAYLNPVVHWFLRKRGRAAAIVAMGRGWGYIGILPISLLLIAYGWRTAALITAVLYLAISLPCALLLRDRPEPYGYRPDGEVAPEDEGDGTPRPPRSDEDGVGVKEAMRQRAFWMLLIGMTVFSFAQQTYNVHFLPFLRFGGFSAAEAAMILTIFGAIQVVGRLGVGFVADRSGRANTMRLGYVLLAAGWGISAFITPATMWLTLPAYYVCYGLGHAAYLVTSQTIVADYFGARRFATIRGMMNPISVVGSVAGPVVAGLSMDMLGTYVPAFLLMVPLLLIGAVSMSAAGRPTMSGEEDRTKPPARP